MSYDTGMPRYDSRIHISSLKKKVGIYIYITHTCMYVCSMYVCMYVCVCLCECVSIHISNNVITYTNCLSFKRNGASILELSKISSTYSLHKLKDILTSHS